MIIFAVLAVITMAYIQSHLGFKNFISLAGIGLFTAFMVALGIVFNPFVLLVAAILTRLGA